MASLSAPPKLIAKTTTDIIIKRKQGQSVGSTIIIQQAKKS